VAQLVVSWFICNGRLRVHAINAIGQRRGRIIEVEDVEPDEREPNVVRETMRAVRETPAPAVDSQMLPMLRSLRRAAWFVVCLLALIIVLTLARR
jgi:hypothetical protein